MAQLVQDVRLAARRLGRTPGFTLLALVTLALGIGANTALFSVVHAVLLKPLPFAEPDQLYWVWSRHTSTDRYPFSLPEFCDYRDRNRTLGALAGFANWTGNLAGEGTTERIPGLRVPGTSSRCWAWLRRSAARCAPPTTSRVTRRSWCCPTYSGSAGSAATPA
jgi:hypothetical protein